MASEYEIWLTTDTGLRLVSLANSPEFTVTKTANDIGRFSLTQPVSFDESLLVRDRLIQVWRSVDGSAPKLFNVYMLRRWIFETSGSSDVVTLAGPDMKDLLRRRIVAAYDESSQAKKTGFADNLMKAYMREAMLDSNPPIPSAGTRVWLRLSVQVDVSAGPTVDRSLPFHKLLTSSGNGVMAVLAKASKELGLEVFYDIVPVEVSTGGILFQFQTKIGQPGEDVTDRVIFGIEFGNMENPKLEFDFSEEENYIYAAGKGETSRRKVVQVYDPSRYTASIWNRCEGASDGREESTTAALTEAGRSSLSDGKPKIRFTAEPMDTEGTRFGRDWDFGSKVRARYRSIEFDTIIRAVSITVNSSGEERIQARLDYETPPELPTIIA